MPKKALRGLSGIKVFELLSRRSYTNSLCTKINKGCTKFK